MTQLAALASPEMVLWDAVQAHLRAAPALRAVVGDKVLDEVPSDLKAVVPPYAYAGPFNRSRLPDSDATAWTIKMRLYVASTGFGRRQAWGLAELLSAALDRTELTLAAPYVAVGEILVIQAGDVIAPPSPKTAFVDIEVIVQKEPTDE